METLSIELIRKLFSYNPETGEIIRIYSYHNAVRVGHIFNSDVTIRVIGITVRHSRLAWALHNGAWPPDGYWIDHINGIKTDNRIVNLRLATPTQNQQNKAGYGQYAKGVTWRDRIDKPYQAKIRTGGKRIHLGSFATEEEAAQAYREAAIKYHGEFACHD